jgi:hypothetical protein
MDRRWIVKDHSDEAIKLIEAAEDNLAQAKSLLLGVPRPEPEQELGARVLAEIVSRGGSVGREDLYKIAADIGMDRRGLGGLFRQTGKTLVHVLPGDRIVLTPEGAERAQKYLDRHRQQVYESGEPQLWRAAEPSFARDWDNERDAAYDDL